MPLEPERGNRIGNLDITIPLATDVVPQGDDHIRALKRALQNTFLGFTPTGTLPLTAEQINGLKYKTGEVGLIKAWAGAIDDIPDGWFIANGATNNGHVTINLIDSFVKTHLTLDEIWLQKDNNFITLVNGEHALSIAEMPSHTHTYTNFRNTKEDGEDNDGALDDIYVSDTFEYLGGGLAHAHAVAELDLRPTYYTTIFIEYCGEVIPDTSPIIPSWDTINVATPAGTDLLTTGDSELRDLKNALQGSFPSFGPEDSIPFSEAEIIEAYEGQGRIGIIYYYHGDPLSPPEGWVLCDGQNGTPELRDKFIVGVSSTDTPTIGGSNSYAGLSNTHTLIQNEIPAHNHPYHTTHDRSHVTVNWNDGSVIVPGAVTETSTPEGGDGPHSHQYDAIDTQPRFRTLHMLMYKGVDV